MSPNKKLMFLTLNGRKIRGENLRNTNHSMLQKPAVWILACRQWLLVVTFLTAFSGSAQQALQNSLVGNSVADARTQNMQSQEYTFKDGDFRLLITPAMSAQWNDNVFLSKTNQSDDYILSPSVGIVSSYPITQRNILFLDINIGYNRYLNNSSLSTFDLNSSSGTGISFDIGIKDVTLNLHDWISYSQDSSQNATVSNTGNYGTFRNTIGISATWDLNQVTLSAGYDHQNVLATRSQFKQINHASEMFFVRSGFQVHPQVNVGLEATAALTTYDQAQLNNNDDYTVGPYLEFRPSSAMQITVRGGYSTYQFQQTSANIQTSGQNTWYAGLTLSHQIMEWLSYSIDAGREQQLGTQYDLSEDYYVRPNINWRFIKGFDLNTGFFYQHGKQGMGSTGSLPLPGSLSQEETYDWYGGNFVVQHALTSSFTLGLTYRLTIRSSNIDNNSYTQNLVGLQLTYQPK